MATDLNPIHRGRLDCCALLLALALAPGVMACGEGALITGPDVVASASPPPGSLVVRGTVFEHTLSGMHPLAGARLRVFQQLPVEQGIKVVDVTSSGDGSYNVVAPETANFFRVQVAPGSPYFTPCPPFTWSVGAPLDVHVVSGAILSTTGIPLSYPTRDRVVISGRVVGRTPGGLEPLSAVTVAMGQAGNPVANTLTDANGRYLLCAVGNPEVAVLVEARKEGYAPASAFDLPWYGWDLDFELTRR